MPRSAKRAAKRPSDPTRKAEDPRTKDGIIGPFCRAYGIEDAIAKFLPEVYLPGDLGGEDPRYTYARGSTANGAVVHDDGLFLYSHHGTDPCSDRLVNAFDMVRIHLFGALDEGQEDDAKPTSLPSYKAAEELIRDDPAVVAELAASYFDDLSTTQSNGSGSGLLKPGSLKFTCTADLEPQAISWVWEGRLARGKLTIIAGDPAMGKSQIGLDAAARISIGGPWPDDGCAPGGSTIILSAEDGVKDTTLPRLIAAGADRRRIHVLESVAGKNGTTRSFNLQADLEALGDAIAALGDVVLVIIDPVTSYLGDVDSHRTSDVRAVLEPVASFAERHGVAILAVSHPPKAPQAKAINAVTGSLAFVAAARMVFLAIAEPKGDRNLLLSVKNNIGPGADGIAYKITSREIDNGIQTSCVAWMAKLSA